MTNERKLCAGGRSKTGFKKEELVRERRGDWRMRLSVGLAAAPSDEAMGSLVNVSVARR